MCRIKYINTVVLLLLLLSANNVFAQNSEAVVAYKGTFFVGGSKDSYYPVTFDDGKWEAGQATILEIGHPDVHRDGSWHGSIIAVLRYHVTRWGHGSSFIDADIKSNKNSFIGGYQDATSTGGTYKIVVWLRGQTTYFYISNAPQQPEYTNSSITVDSKVYSIKNQPDAYVNPNGKSLNTSLWVVGSIASYFADRVGIKTKTPDYELDVVGTIRAHQVLVNTQKGADFVFEDGYNLRPLGEVEQFITENKHLPDIAPASSMQQNGVDMGELQIQLLQKIEELTLYIIELKKESRMQQKEIKLLKQAYTNL